MSTKKIIVCNAHEEEISVKVDGDKTNLTRECMGGGGSVSVPVIGNIRAHGKMEKENDIKTVSKENSFTIVGPGVKMSFPTSTDNVLLTIRLKNGT